MARRRSSLLALAAAIVLAIAPGTGRTAGCKLALVLALDISSSVNQREYKIQLQGLVRAFRTPEVIAAILTPKGTAGERDIERSRKSGLSSVLVGFQQE